MGLAVLVGYGAGWWLDQTFNTQPYLTIVMLLVGVAAGFNALIRVARELKRAEERVSDQEQRREEFNDR